MRKYFNESHRKYSEACQKEVEEMSKHPLSHEQFRAQIKRNREESERRRKESTIWPSRTMTTPTLQTLERPETQTRRRGRLYLILRPQNTVFGGLDLDDAVAG